MVMDIVLYCFLGILSVGLAVIGGHVSSKNLNHKIGFYVIGGISICLIIVTGIRNYHAQKEFKKASEQLNETIKSIKNMSTETVRIGRLNTELQDRLLEQTKTIEDLSKETINITIGGDSFGYISVVKPWASDHFIPVFIHVGEYPLYGISALISDQEKYRNFRDNHGEISYTDFQSNFPEYYIGDISNNRGMLLKQIPISNNSEHSFNISFKARNGSWQQSLKIMSINGKYFIATQVHSYKEQKKGKLLYELIDDGFPRNEKGEIDWYK